MYGSKDMAICNISEYEENSSLPPFVTIWTLSPTYLSKIFSLCQSCLHPMKNIVKKTKFMILLCAVKSYGYFQYAGILRIAITFGPYIVES